MSPSKKLTRLKQNNKNKKKKKKEKRNSAGKININYSEQ
jgi:hypothetical protein